MNTTRFNERMKLADIICANPSLILMLPRFGIPLGFGDQTVQQVCRQHQVSADFVILIFNRGNESPTLNIKCSGLLLVYCSDF